MKVKIIPKKPIVGILPKNKWIDEETELDLNNIEIVRCMQFGSVYDENGNLIDFEYLKAMSKSEKKEKPPILNSINNKENAKQFKERFDKAIEVCNRREENLTLKSLDRNDNKNKLMKISEDENNSIKAPDMKRFTDSMKNPEIVESFNTRISEMQEQLPKTVTPEYKASISVISCVKENDYIILETQINTEEKLSGKLYGLFAVLGARPSSLEYKIEEDKWVKFNNKFNNFSEIENETKFVFRMVPKNNSVIKYKLSIKEAVSTLADLSDEINPENL